MKNELTNCIHSSVTSKPTWLKVKAPGDRVFNQTASHIHHNAMKTVCEEAACPNVGSCWSNDHAAFMIMGDICTRGCAFCNVKTGKPFALDPTEPMRLANTVKAMGLTHVVITSVDRDDLPDGGAGHFQKVIDIVRIQNPDTSVEILTPDFRHKLHALSIIEKNPPDVFNHNTETVPRLYGKMKPGGNYFRSLTLLKEAKQYMPNVFTKSGLIVGMGETFDEVVSVMDDLREANVDFLTIGQYLQPTKKHIPIVEFIPPATFKRYEKLAYYKGFLLVSASPLTRSSFHADKDFKKLQAIRNATQAI